MIGIHVIGNRIIGNRKIKTMNSKYFFNNDKINTMIILCNKCKDDDLEIDNTNKKIYSRGAKISTKEHGRHYQGDVFNINKTWNDSHDHAWITEGKRLIWKNCGIRFYGCDDKRLMKLEKLLQDDYELIFDEETDKLLTIINC